MIEFLADSSNSNIIMMECDTPEEAQRKSVQRLIERYYYQLTQGCGRHCDNPLCFSSGAITSPLAPNEAAAKALQCLKVH